MSDFDFLNDYQGDMKGFEGISPDTLAIPFIRILQDMSAVTKKKSENYIDGAEAGQFLLTDDNSLHEALTVTVLNFDRMRLEWTPIDEGGGFHGAWTIEQAMEKASGPTPDFGDWETADGTILQDTYIYLVLIVGQEHKGPYVLSLKSSSIPIAKKLNRSLVTTLLPNGETAMPYMMTYRLKTKYVEKGNNAYFVLDFDEKEKGFVTKETFSKVTDERKVLETTTKKIDYSKAETREIEDSSNPLDSEDSENPFN